jgi:hypothetical protein
MIAMRRIDLEVFVNLQIAVWHYFCAHVPKLTVSGGGWPPAPRVSERRGPQALAGSE